MGSHIEINDTLRISKDQGFPAELDITTHIQTPYAYSEVADRIFSFSGKSGIRIYKQPPVRNFLVENVDDKWLYWGLCYILSINHDYGAGMTTGTYKIVRLNTPSEMKQMFALTHLTNPEQNYFDN